MIDKTAAVLIDQNGETSGYLHNLENVYLFWAETPAIKFHQAQHIVAKFFVRKITLATPSGLPEPASHAPRARAHERTHARMTDSRRAPPLRKGRGLWGAGPERLAD